MECPTPLAVLTRIWGPHIGVGEAASAGLEGRLDREPLDGYITAASRLVWKTPWPSWKTSSKSAVKSAASVGNGVTVAQQTLTLFVLVRIQVPQPLQEIPIHSDTFRLIPLFSGFR